MEKKLIFKIFRNSKLTVKIWTIKILKESIKKEGENTKFTTNTERNNTKYNPPFRNPWPLKKKNSQSLKSKKNHFKLKIKKKEKRKKKETDSNAKNQEKSNKYFEKK